MTRSTAAWSTTRSSRQARGYGRAWEIARERILARDCGLCQPCRRRGRLTPATEVDHVKPKSAGGTDDEDNLQSICSSCHQAKTIEDSGKKPRIEVGVDGWPVDDRRGGSNPSGDRS